MDVLGKNGQTAVITVSGLSVLARVLLRQLSKTDLHDQVTLIAGGSRGLGFLLARDFGRAGCKVAICARDKRELETARKALEEQEITVMAVPCDLTDPGSVDRTVAAVSARFGRIDILVNNASIIRVGPAQEMTRADYEQVMDINFWGVFNATQAVLPQMRARRNGRIVNITSIGGKVSVPHLLPYSCAKFAAVGFSEGLRAELARDGIAVTTIVPGEMRTGSYPNADYKGDQESEFTWFAASSSLPFLSMDAERAAAQIVDATRHGKAERILSVPANVLARFHGLFPGTTCDILGLANRLLPQPTGKHNGVVRGKQVQGRTQSPLLRNLTTWGRSAARRFNE